MFQPISTQLGHGYNYGEVAEIIISIFNLFWKNMTQLYYPSSFKAILIIF